METPELTPRLVLAVLAIFVGVIGMSVALAGHIIVGIVMMVVGLGIALDNDRVKRREKRERKRQ